jgi:hypothetical protein
MCEANDRRETTEPTVTRDSSGSSVNPDCHTDSPISQPPMESVYKEKASVARLNTLEKILGQYLLECMETSHMRRSEENRENMGPIRLTSAVSLYIAGQSGKDYQLEITLGPLLGNAISNQLAEMKSIEDLEMILGEYVFAGMKTSNYRKEEEGKRMLVSTSAVRVSFPGGSGSSDDCKLEVMVGYEKGREIWYAAF